MILLTLRDLVHRRVRFVVVSVLSAVVFSLLFVMTGLVEQFNREPYDAVDAIGATHWVLAAGVTGPFTAASSLPSSALGGIDADLVSPVVSARSSLGHGGVNDEIVLIGAVPGALGTPRVVEGRAAEVAGEAVVDEIVGVDPGDVVTVAGVPFTVVGVSRDTTVLAGIPLVFVPLDDSQQIVFRSADVVSGFLTSGPPRSLPDGTTAITADEVGADTLGPLDGAIASIDLLRGLLWVVAAIIVGAVVYLSALERERDFAVLKAIGTSTRSLLGSLALQAMLVALLSVALAAAMQLLLVPAFPLKVRVPARAFWQIPVVAVVMALLAGIAGMRRVARADPALAFAGAGG